jgi:hypothetical protein
VVVVAEVVVELIVVVVVDPVVVVMVVVVTVVVVIVVVVIVEPSVLRDESNSQGNERHAIHTCAGLHVSNLESHGGNGQASERSKGMPFDRTHMCWASRQHLWKPKTLIEHASEARAPCWCPCW